jgi:hypothetical protein
MTRRQTSDRTELSNIIVAATVVKIRRERQLVTVILGHSILEKTVDYLWA